MGKVPPSAISIVQGEEMQFDDTVSDSVKQVILSAVVPAIKKRLPKVDAFINLKASAHGGNIQNEELKEQPGTPNPTEETQIVGNDKSIIDNPIIKKLLDDMVPVEGGTFKMGATPEQGSDTYSNEKPVHQVTLNDFYISKYEVTQELWQAVMGNNPSNFKNNPQNPVENVSWNDCQEFIKKLNKMTDKTFRLPTEAEWEFAARGGNKSKGYKYSGSNTLDYVAWYEDNSGKMTHPVGLKSPNELGLYDMSGNVCEWCQDWYGDYSSGSQTNPLGSSGSYRVNRGGSWFNSARYCRVSLRDYGTPAPSITHLGLRLAL